MKKTMMVLSALAMVGTTILSCGPSAEEIEKVRQDSIRRADSVAAVKAAEEARQKAIQDSIAAAEQARLAREQFVADSIAAAEAEAAKKKGGKKTTAKKEEPKTNITKGGTSTGTTTPGKTEEKPKLTKGGK